MKSNQNKIDCITDASLQMYIDKELPVETVISVELHLKTCKNCRQRLEDKKEFIEDFKNSWPSIQENKIEIASFRNYIKSEHSPILHYLKQWKWAAAAILIIGLLTIFQKTSKQSQTETQYIIYDSQMEIDANKPWHEQEMEVYFIEEKNN